MTVPSRDVAIGPYTLGQARPLTIIAGPCAIESREHTLMMAREVKAIADAVQMPVIFKSSFDKANRTSATSGRGVGIEEGLSILAEAREMTGLPVLTDVHESWQCGPVGEVVDVIQIPAFLCRQSDLLKAAAETGRAINIKKGQFLAPWDMAQVTAKLEAFGAERVLVCERGASFGYNTLVSDMRSLSYLARTGWPVVFDATHSVQQPGGLGGSSGGQREFVPLLARAAVAVGVAAVFIETHDAPERALSDGPNQVPLLRLREVLLDLKRFDELAKAEPLVELA